MATPLLAALAMVAAFDLMFAIDSIPAIFAITRDTFVVFAANAFSLLGMVSLYFVLESCSRGSATSISPWRRSSATSPPRCCSRTCGIHRSACPSR